MKLRTDIHIARRLYHALGVSVGTYAYLKFPLSFSIKFISTLCAIGVVLEFLRAKSPQFNRKLMVFFGAFVRRNELKSLTGMTYLVFGALLVIVVFEPKITALALFMLAIGDPVSSIVGIAIGKRKLIGKKTIAGALAGLTACTIVSILYFHFSELVTFPKLIWLSLCTGFIGMTSELVPVGKLDDNFTFPVISASLIWILFQFLNI